jgi:hypothetical protein
MTSATLSFIDERQVLTVIQPMLSLFILLVTLLMLRSFLLSLFILVLTLLLSPLLSRFSLLLTQMLLLML